MKFIEVRNLLMCEVFLVKFIVQLLFLCSFTVSIYFPHVWGWADPGGTARPGQPVEKSEQAPASSPRIKNQFNIDGPQWGPYQILS